MMNELRLAEKAILLTSHDISGVLRTATHVGVLSKGLLAVSESVDLFKRRDLREALQS
jgi:ABC-type Mn2+/Zn2+ transport system ATPase subunit